MTSENAMKLCFKNMLHYVFKATMVADSTLSIWEYSTICISHLICVLHLVSDMQVLAETHFQQLDFMIINRCILVKVPEISNSYSCLKITILLQMHVAIVKPELKLARLDQ